MSNRNKVYESNGDIVNNNDRLFLNKSQTLNHKQNELQNVIDEHDGLIRELFHLEKFTTIAKYDPVIAKEDKSEVFENFKQPYDLISKLPQDNDSNGSKPTTRKTRRAVSSFKDSINLPRNSSNNQSTTNKVKNYKLQSPQSTTPEFNSPSTSYITPVSVDRPSTTGVKRRVVFNDIDTFDTEDEPEYRINPIHPIGDILPKFIVSRKRSKINLKLPNPVHTHHDQVPSFDKRYKFIDDYLESFISLDNDEVMDNESYENKVSNDISILRRLNNLKDSGEVMTLKTRNGKISTAPSNMKPMNGPPPKLSHHDHLLDAVLQQSNIIRNQNKIQITQCKKISKSVMNYHEKSKFVSERAKKEEERRIKALARWTVREVRRKWKVAIDVIRNKKRAEERKDLDKRQAQHLDAIIEQSHQMLGAQKAGIKKNYDDNFDFDDDNDNDEIFSDVNASIDEPIHSNNAKDLQDAIDRADDDSDDNLVSVKDDEKISEDEDEDEDEDENLTYMLLDYEAPDSVQPESVSEIQTDNVKEIFENKFDDDIQHEEIQENNVQNGINEISKLDHESSDDDVEVADLKYDQDMDDDADKSDDSELEGLDEDANLPIEKLMEKYGYVQNAQVNNDDVENKYNENNENQTDNADVNLLELEDPSEKFKIVDDDLNSLKADASSDKLRISIPKSQQFSSDSDAHHLKEIRTVSLRSEEEEELFKQQQIERILGDEYKDKSKPFLFRGQLREYQKTGYEWLVSLYQNDTNGILADEMGLGKTIQTIALFAHLAQTGDWGPHLIVVPTSVMLNWEMEFKKFLPGFKVITYYGSIRERKEKRAGWNTENFFNVCITSYQIVLQDQHLFRRKAWGYMILDEAHQIKNFKSTRWQTLLGFNARRRLLLTGTPLQNDLTELWALLYFLMPPTALSQSLHGTGFANQSEFADWFGSIESGKAVQSGEAMDDQTKITVNKLQTLLRPYLLRRLKRDVEQQLPAKVEHIVKCRLSKRQRFLYDEFMSRSDTKATLASGNFMSIINIMMQLRRVCNHPDLFEVRPIVTSFAMPRSATSDFEIKELLVRKRLLSEDKFNKIDLNNLKLVPTQQDQSMTTSLSLNKLNASHLLPYFNDNVEEIPPSLDLYTVEGNTKYRQYQERKALKDRWKSMIRVNNQRCSGLPIMSSSIINQLTLKPKVFPLEFAEKDRINYLNYSDKLSSLILSYSQREQLMSEIVDKFAFCTPTVVANDMPKLMFKDSKFDEWAIEKNEIDDFDILHHSAVKHQIAFPDASLIQYDCGKLQELDVLLRDFKANGHRVLIFTQMTKVLDVLEVFLNVHGHRYLRLDGATKVEQRQLLTERFNTDPRILAFILSSRAGGIGINLTGADRVIFYDSDWNPAMDRQCQDRCHRIGQTRDVHIFRFVSLHTIEENMLRKATQKANLDNLVIQEGEYTTEYLQKFSWREMLGIEKDNDEDQDQDMVTAPNSNVERAFADAEDDDDAKAAAIARGEQTHELDEADFEDKDEETPQQSQPIDDANEDVEMTIDNDEDEDEDNSVDDYMLRFVEMYWDIMGP